MQCRERDDLIHAIRALLARGGPTPEESANFRGRLGYEQSLVFGRLGRAFLHPLTDRQYCRRALEVYPLNVDLRESLTWRADTIAPTIPRRGDLHLKRPILAYSDACSAGHVGGAVVVGGVFSTSRTHFPAWLRAMGIGIFEFALAVALSALLVGLEWSPGRPIFTCCDNDGANGTVVRGSCKTDVGRYLTDSVLPASASADVNVCAEYVGSDANCADHLRKFAHDWGVSGVRLDVANRGIPASFSRATQSLSAFVSSGIRLRAAERGMVSARTCPDGLVVA